MRKMSVILLLLTTIVVTAQKPKQASSAELYQQVQKLGVLGNVLYLAAHPDDENTRFIAYCANEKLYNTAYLSLTRGDGGQNLIGPEIREELGIIRTQELLAARRTDGGQQFFSRANDFGYSKTPEETLAIWDKDKILSDVVWAIRKFRPDVIVCRFPTDGGGGHGHHTSSALLGVEAFDLAADETKYPEQLKYVDTWQAKRIVVNTGRWWNKNISADDEGVVAEDIGLYNNRLGISYNELAAKSRTMHKSQGFGSTGSRGEHLEFFEHLKGEEAKTSLFDGMQSSWRRIEGSKTIYELIVKLQTEFDVAHPQKSIQYLVSLKKELKNLKDEYWKAIKIAEVDELIKQCAGLYLEAKANQYSAIVGDSIIIDYEMISRSYQNLKIKSVYSKELNFKFKVDSILPLNKKEQFKQTLFVPAALEISQPYWLKQEGTLGTYKVDDQLKIGTPENKPAIVFNVVCEIEGQEVVYQMPLIYKWNDPVKGELYRPFVITPPAFVNFAEEIHLFSVLQEREVELIVKSGKSNFTGGLIINVPTGWNIKENNFKLNLTKKGEEQKLTVLVTPSANAAPGFLTASITSNGKTYSSALKEITYDHIPTQVYMPESKAKLVYIQLNKKGTKVAYIKGAGDVLPEGLRNIGYQVDELSENEITTANLAQYDAVLMGIRALNTNTRVDFYMDKLLDYCKNGGNLIVQYNTSHRLKTDKFSPYPLKLSRDRVTEEDAEVVFLKPKHEVLNTPNKITQKDFDGWVQERGLYFPNEWDKQYNAILSWHDKGEEAKEGALLVAKYGKGNYVYTGISFFREMPAGVPGAYRLLVNLISLKNE